MKKLLLAAALGVAGLMSAADNHNFLEVEKKVNGDIVFSECNTQTTKDADGDDISVTCCRTTYKEAYDCAASKLRKLAFQPAEISKDTSSN